MHINEQFIVAKYLSLEKLKIYNAFYKLKISEEEIKFLEALKAKVDPIYTDKFRYSYPITYISTTTIENYLLGMCWNINNENGQVVLFKKPELHENPLIAKGQIVNKVLPGTFYCFSGFCSDLGKGGLLYPLEKLPSIDILTYFSQLLSDTRYYGRDFNYEKNLIVPEKAFTSETLKIFLKDAPKYIERLLDKAINEQTLKTISWLLEDNTIIEQYQNAIRNKSSSIISFYHKIITVIELKNNTRIAIFSSKEHYGSSVQLSFSIIPADADEYQYIDIGRIVYFPARKDRYGYNSGQTQIPSKGVYFIDETPTLPRDEEFLTHLQKKRDINTSFIRNEDIAKYLAEYESKLSKEDEKKRQKGVRKEKVDKRIEEIDTNLNKSITINEVTYSKDKIEYAGQILSSTNVNISKFLQTMLRRMLEEDLNFDMTFEGFLAAIFNMTPTNEEKAIGKLGNVDFTFEVKKGKNTRGVDYNHYYINGRRINGDEVTPVLRQAVCFTTNEDFQHFVSQVSKCSLRIHKILGEGIDVFVQDNFIGMRLQAKLPILRKNNRHYLDINKKQYAIRDLNRLVIAKCPKNMDHLLEILTNPDIVDIPDISEVSSIVEGAKEAYAAAIKKSHELLSDVEKKFDLKLQTVDLKGVKRSGYIVQGILRQYFIEARETNKHTRYQVYDFPSGSARCIVDKAGAHMEVGVDRLVNRIYALRNDKYVANKITTL